LGNLIVNESLKLLCLDFELFVLLSFSVEVHFHRKVFSGEKLLEDDSTVPHNFLVGPHSTLNPDYLLRKFDKFLAEQLDGLGSPHKTKENLLCSCLNLMRLSYDSYSGCVFKG